MGTFTQVAVALALVFTPALPLAAERNDAPVQEAAGERGFIPSHGPSRATGPTAGFVDDPRHQREPHVHADGRWVGHAEPGEPGLHVTQPFAQGRFPGATGDGKAYALRGGNRAGFAAGQGFFAVAPIEYGFCDEWSWNGDSIAIFDDPDHPGWYLALNVPLGTYVHVRYRSAADDQPAKRSRSRFLDRLAGFLGRGIRVVAGGD